MFLCRFWISNDTKCVLMCVIGGGGGGKAIYLPNPASILRQCDIIYSVIKMNFVTIRAVIFSIFDDDKASIDWNQPTIKAIGCTDTYKNRRNCYYNNTDFWFMCSHRDIDNEGYENQFLLSVIHFIVSFASGIEVSLHCIDIFCYCVCLVFVFIFEFTLLEYDNRTNCENWKVI